MSVLRESNPRLSANLSPAGAWAFAIGTSVGWGSLVVTSNTYLAQAGPLGSALGLLIGAVVMLVIGWNYAYLMNAFPESGGAYAYAREMFGYDQGFLVSWFLILTYLAMLWANATSLPLFSRYFLGGAFRFGRLFTIFGHEVCLGDALLSIAAILLTACLCARGKGLAARLMLVMAALFTAGIVICFAAAMLRRDVALAPAYVPDGRAISQIIKIACISPWAFIGFESISHGVEEFSFRRSRASRVLIVTVLSTALLYVCVTLLSVTAFPPEYGSWLGYIRDLDHLSGIEGLPAFYAASHYMGGAGVTILMLSLLALVFTSLIGNLTALSRLCCALGRDGVLPKRYGALNDRGVPGNAIRLIAGVSIVVPFLGRTAIGWIVDVTMLGATMVYAFVSAAARRLARRRGDGAEVKTGVVGLIAIVGFGAYMLVPNLFASGSMATESYFLFVVWAILGFIYFRHILRNDGERRFGQSIIVWIALLSLVLFISLIWMSQSIMDATSRGMTNVEAFYTEAGLTQTQAGLVAQQMAMVRQTSVRSIVVVIFIFALSLGILMNNYNLMSRRAKESETQLDLVRDKANRDPLTGVKSKHAYAETEALVNADIAAGRPAPFALVLCDVNGLKLVNDTRGHKAGDEYIRDACHMICHVFQHSPVFRTGGDEFVVFLTGEDYADREALLEELHRRSVAHIASGEVVVSGGMSDYAAGDANLHDVFERADARMYEEKRLLKRLGAPTR